jgi:hypothetical protein
MRKTQHEQKTKQKPDDYAKRLTGLFYLQAVLPEQNDIILLLTIKNSATPLFALNSAMCSRILLHVATLFTSRH